MDENKKENKNDITIYDISKDDLYEVYINSLSIRRFASVIGYSYAMVEKLTKRGLSRIDILDHYGCYGVMESSAKEMLKLKEILKQKEMEMLEGEQ